MPPDTQPKFGTSEYAILSQAQTLTLRIFIHNLRILELDDRRGALRRELPDDWSRVDAERINSFQDSIEDDAIIVAANRLHRWLSLAKRKKILPLDFGAQFFALAPSIKEVRDMREHHEEYLMGGGRDPDKFAHFFEVEDGKGYCIDAATTFSLDGVQYYGGRVPAEELALSVRALYDEFVALGLWIHSFTLDQILREYRRPYAGSPPDVA